MSGQGIAQFIPLILIFVIFYFFLIRPQQKRVKDHKAMVESLKRGDEVINTNAPIQVPVGPETLGRIINVIGEPIDERGEVKTKESWPIHRPSPEFNDQSTETEISTLAFSPPKDLLTFFTSKRLILIPPVIYDLFHLQLLQIFQDIFLLTNPLIPLGNKLQLQQSKLLTQHIASLI